MIQGFIDAWPSWYFVGQASAYALMALVIIAALCIEDRAKEGKP